MAYCIACNCPQSTALSQRVHLCNDHQVYVPLHRVDHSANQEKIAMDVTLEEGYSNISHPGLRMAPISCQKQGDVQYIRMDTGLILLRKTRGTENETQRQGATKRAST